MKRIVSILLAILMVLSLVACDDPTVEINTDHSTTIGDEEESTSIEQTENTTRAVDNEVDTEILTQEPTTEETEEGETLLTSQKHPLESYFSVLFIDVGHADAALVECDGHYMLIDGGNKADSDRIYSVLKKAEVPKLDIVVGTHAHEEHIGGLAGAFNYTTADITLCPVSAYDSDAFNNFKKYANSKGGGIIIPRVGESYVLGRALMTILGVNGGSGANDASIILRVDYGETSFLFTGDAEYDAEQAVLNSGMNLNATVLKVGHHGSDTSTGYSFLSEIMPQYAIISSGIDNAYGHPTEGILSRLSDAGVTIFRTDLNGDITIVSDGREVSVSVEKQASIDDIMTPGGSTVLDSPASLSTEDTNSGDKANAADYIINVNTGKFHYPSCASVKRMKESNKRFFNGTRDELINRGYSPCGNCHP